MDSDDLYDELGNFLGDANDSDADSEYEANADFESKSTVKDDTDKGTSLLDDVVESTSEHQGEIEGTELVASDRLEERHPKVETIIVDPTVEGSDEPVIRPIEEQTLRLEYKSNFPETVYAKEYLHDLSKTLPERVRNVAVVGHLHTGKTSLVDTFVTETHPKISGTKKIDHDIKPLRYLDTHKLENERGISIHSAAVSLLLQDSRDRSFAFNIVDCPGHPDFRDEIYALLAAVEGVVFVLDIVEGLTSADKKIMTEVIRRNLPLVVTLNKIDRLILELQLPPKDAFQKIRYVLNDINGHIYHNEYAVSYTHEKLISPLKGNVVFASHKLKTSFTLSTWSRLYAETGQMQLIDEEQFRMLLWGEVYFENGKFTKSELVHSTPTTFEQFILEPMYKLVAHTLVSDHGDKTLALLLWDQFRVSLPKTCYKSDPQTLLQEVFKTIFRNSKDFVHLLVTTVGLPRGGHVLRSRGLDPERFSENDVVAEVFKMNICLDGSSFECLTKIHKGTLKSGDKVHVLGSNYAEDKDGLRTEVIGSICLPVGRYSMRVEQAYEGTIVAITGICKAISKSATLFSQSTPLSQLGSIHKLDNGKHAFYKVAVACEHPSELPKLVVGLQKLTKSYLSAIIKLEESGEHVLFAPGELYLDCFLHDLRYAGGKYLLVRVSDPMVKFAEACAERSVAKVTVSTPSKLHKLSVIAEPVGDKRLLRAIEKGDISLVQPQKVTARLLKEEFHWDALAARSIWSFGPKDMQDPSMLVDDSIEGETDKTGLRDARTLIAVGFDLAVNEGPLCDEPIRRTRFKILDAVLAPNLQKSGGQIIHMTRNAVHSGLLTAAPRLLEPMYRVHVTCTYKSVTAVHTILEKRRGWAVSELPIVATQLYEIEGCVPIIDSVGLDTDMRLYTQGQAFCSMEFFRWDIVPGDPMDTLCVLPAMKPVPRASLARDFVLKTRRRKGLSGEPTLQKYIDPEVYSRLKQSGIVM